MPIDPTLRALLIRARDILDQSSVKEGQPGARPAVDEIEALLGPAVEVEAPALKPCPFCGHEAVPPSSGFIHWFQVRCGREFTVPDPGCGTTGPLRRTPEEAIEAWNQAGDLRSLKMTSMSTEAFSKKLDEAHARFERITQERDEAYDALTRLANGVMRDGLGFTESTPLNVEYIVDCVKAAMQAKAANGFKADADTLRGMLERANEHVNALEKTEAFLRHEVARLDGSLKARPVEAIMKERDAADAQVRQLRDSLTASEGSVARLREVHESDERTIERLREWLAEAVKAKDVALQANENQRETIESMRESLDRGTKIAARSLYALSVARNYVANNGGIGHKEVLDIITEACGAFPAPIAEFPSNDGSTAQSIRLEALILDLQSQRVPSPGDLVEALANVNARLKLLERITFGEGEHGPEKK